MWEYLLISAVLQGLTEFLPVSSSGHLRLVQHFFALEEPQTFIDLCLHFGTLIAVVWFYRESILRLVTSLFRREDASGRKVILLLVCGTIPTGLIGVGLGDWFEYQLSSLPWVGVWLCATGLMLWATRHSEGGKRKASSLRPFEAAVIGTVQGFAVLRGISRSGSTISVGLWMGLEREAAAEFSFLLSIPAILGAVLLKGLGDEHLAFSESELMPLVVCTGVSALVGYGALRLLVAIVRVGNLYRFAPYCWIIGGIALATGLVK